MEIEEAYDLQGMCPVMDNGKVTIGDPQPLPKVMPLPLYCSPPECGNGEVEKPFEECDYEALETGCDVGFYCDELCVCKRDLG
jgi:hypothetical protein